MNDDNYNRQDNSDKKLKVIAIFALGAGVAALGYLTIISRTHQLSKT